MKNLLRYAALPCVSLLFFATRLQAQAVPEAAMSAVRAAASGCEITAVRRIPGDTVVVELTDSTFTKARWEDMTWNLCGGYGNGVNTRDVSRTIAGPLWAAWLTLPSVKVASFVIVSRPPETITLTLRFPPPPGMAP